MNTYNELREALIEALKYKASEWAEIGFDRSDVGDHIDDLLDEIKEWEKEHGIEDGLAEYST